MEGVSLYVLLFAVMLIFFIASGVWIGTLLGAMGIIYFYFFVGAGSLESLGYLVYNAWSSYTLSAIPLFVFMASILSSSGVGERLFSGSAALFSRLPGGLIHANIWASAGFSAICGSTMATTAAISQVSLPYMEREKYPERLAIGSLLAAGGLGLMIPPSVSFIVYGAICEVSVGKLFMAGIFPGIMLAILFSTYVAIRCKITDYHIPQTKLSFGKTLLSLLSTWPVAVLFLSLMGAIFFGVATPTEAAGCGVTFALIVSIALKKFSRSMLITAFTSALRVSVMLLFIFSMGMVLGKSVSYLGVPQALARYLSSGFSPLQVLMMITAMYVVMGCVMDGLAIKLTTLPIIFPIIKALGIDPIWFGVVAVIYGEVAAITPPIGSNLFVLQGITGKPLDRIAASVLPFFLLYMLAIVILYVFPQIALFLPQLMFG